MGGPAYSLLWAYIVFSIIIFFVGQFVLHKTLNYDNVKLWKNSYIPSLEVILLFVPIVVVDLKIHPLVNIVLIESYLLFLIYIVGLSIKEKSVVKMFIINKLNRL